MNVDQQLIPRASQLLQLWYTMLTTVLILQLWYIMLTTVLIRYVFFFHLWKCAKFSNFSDCHLEERPYTHNLTGINEEFTLGAALGSSIF